MTKAVVDANILLSVFELETDFISDLRKQFTEVVTISAVKNELERRNDKKGHMAVQLIERAKIPVIQVPMDTDVDTTLLGFCEANLATLVTQDKELLKRAKQKALKTLGIRQKKYIN